jgi:hypothetical protein
MPILFDTYKSGSQLSPRSIAIWRVVQFLVWLVGAIIFGCLLLYPDTGVLLFWNILIPIAPALIVLAPGIWRNVCPLASTVLFPRHMGWSKRMKMTVSQQGKLSLVAITALYLIVPLRHAVFNVSGHATAILLVAATLVGVVMGFVYEWKSGWCSSLCPVHPVEKLYGNNVLFELPNAHCHQCMNCVIPCPDSTPNIQPQASQKTIYHRISGFLTIGGLPGFIWGWFHEPDDRNHFTASGMMDIYSMPMAGLVVTLLLFWLLTKIFHEKRDKTITAIFAAASVSCYYWYRIPSLLGFGKFPDDGLLVNLRDAIPYWAILLTIILTTLFFFIWIVLRRSSKNSWVIRPEFESRAAA